MPRPASGQARVNAGRQALRYRTVPVPHTVTHSHLQCGTGCLSLFRFAPQAQQIPTVWVPREMNHASGIISDSLSFSSHSPAGSGVMLGRGPGLASSPGADLRGRYRADRATQHHRQVALQPALHAQYLHTHPTLPRCHPPSPPPTTVGKTTADQLKASLRDWVLLDGETVTLGSCYVSSGSSGQVPRYR